MRFISIPLRSLRHRPLRSALTIVGVTVAVGGFSILTGLGRGLEEAWNSSLVGQGTQLLAYRRGTLDVLAGSLDESLAAEMRVVPGVVAVAAELVDVMTLESGESILVRGWEPDSMLWSATELIDGRMPVGGGATEAVIGEALAGALGLATGDRIRPFGAALEIVGVVRMEGVLSNSSLIVPLSALQRLLDRGDKITALHVRVEQGHDGGALQAARERLSGLFPKLVLVEGRSAAQQNELYRFWRGMAWAASFVGLAMGFVIVVNTLLVAVLERTREIGVLVAVGWSRRRILGLVLLESLLLSAAGGLVGMLLGHFGLELLVDHPRLRGFVAVVPSAAAFAQLLLVTVLLGVAGGFYPAWRAMNLNPVDALRDQ